MIFCDFSDLVDGEEFTDLNCKEVTRLISSDKLNVSSEEKVWNSSVRLIVNLTIFSKLDRYMKL